MTVVDNVVDNKIVPLHGMSGALAAELAMRLEPAQNIFDRYGIDDATSLALLANKEFQGMVVQAKQAWEGASNATERVRMKALIAVEEMMPRMFGRAMSTDTPLAAANDTFKTMKALAGMDAKEPPQGHAGFNFTINLTGGDKPEAITVEGEALSVPPVTLQLDRMIETGEAPDLSSWVDK